MLILFAPIALIGGCLVLSEVPTSTIRFRVTVEVDTPQGVRSGSSVMQSSFYNMSGVISGSMARLKGQAVFVDLGEGRNVVMLLAHGPKAEDGDTFKALPVTALTGAGWGWNAGKALRERGGSLSGAVDLTGKLIPTLVTIPNTSDPASVRTVEPTGEGFSNTFGPGYTLGRVRVETVSQGLWPLNALEIWGTPLTTGIESKIPFLVSYRSKLWWQNTAPSDPYIPQFHHFLRGSRDE
jgi:hypothetical protein